MPELEDYSGPFNPDLKFEDFSKDFLLKLMNVWQFSYIHMLGAWYYAIKKRFGPEAANACEYWEVVRIGQRVLPKYYPQLANIEVNTALDAVKLIQLTLDNILPSGLFPAKFDIKSPNHVIMTVYNCRVLHFLERDAPERIASVCHVLEGAALEKFAVNPKIKVTPLKLPPLPPQKRTGELCCQFEYKLEE